LPFADFCDMVKVNRFTFSHESVTCRRSPEVSLTAFDAQPPDLQPVPLMDMDFAVVCPLVQHRMPQIRFLYIGSRLCSALLSGPASRRVLFHPCASLSLHVHHVVKRTFTSKRSNMLGTQTKSPLLRVGRKFLFSLCLDDGPSLPVGPVRKSPSVAIGREFHERQSTQSAEKRKPYSWLAPIARRNSCAGLERQAGFHDGAFLRVAPTPVSCSLVPLPWWPLRPAWHRSCQ